MSTDSMYARLQNLPLFKGVSHEKISEMVGKNRFHFLKYTPGETIIQAGDPCSHIISIVSGSVRSTIHTTDRKFTVSETLDSPGVIALDYFFGRTTRYPSTVTALTTVGLLQLDKSDYLSIINNDAVSLFNFLNLLSLNSQLAVEGILALSSGDLRKRIAYWIVALTDRDARDIVMECRHRDLYTVFGVQRQSLLVALDTMKDEGIIDYEPNRILVPDRKKLLEVLDL